MPPRKRTRTTGKENPHAVRIRRARERAAVRGTCRRCGAQILTGLDNDVTALTARVDPELLSAGEELLARADGRRTYRLRPALRSGDDLWLRDRWQIAGEPANPADDLLVGVRVVAEHRCSSPSGAAGGQP